MKWAPRERSEAAPLALRSRLNRLFDEFLEEGLTNAPPFRFDPTLDVGETPEAVIVKAEMPGIEAKDIDISVNGELLNIRGEKRQEKEEKDEAWYHLERSHGSFDRTVRLPAAVKEDAVEAEMGNGLLTITLPKTEKSTTKRIAVRKSR